MNTNNKIGVGIITCDRPIYLKKLVNSLQDIEIDKICIVNDGITQIEANNKIKIINNTPPKQGVGKTKNKALKYLKDCNYIFLLEDDIVIKNKNVFQKYIEACQVSGIQHFNYGPGTPFNRKQNVEFDLHNRHELNQNSEPSPRLTIDYGSLKISLYAHIAGMFSFFTKQVIDKVGYIDEEYYNAWEHVDHTYRIIKAGYHPPFWWFADIENSHEYIDQADEAIKESAIAKDTQEWVSNVKKGSELYLQKHGHYPNRPPHATKEEVISSLKKIKNG